MSDCHCDGCNERREALSPIHDPKHPMFAHRIDAPATSNPLPPHCARCDAGDRAEPDADLRRVLVELADAADAVERHEHDYPFAQVMCVGPRGVYVWCDTPTGRAAEAEYKIVGHRYAKARLDVLAHARRVRATRGA